MVTINGHSNRVRIWENGAGLRGPWERQLKRWEEDRRSPRDWLYAERPKPYDAHATGELNASVLGRSPREGSWGDRKRWRLEDRLPQLVRELEVRAVEAEERRLERERQQAERQRQWEAAMEHAKRRLLADHRLGVLRDRVREWQDAEAIRAYCDAVQARHGGGDRRGPRRERIARLRSKAGRATPTATDDAARPRSRSRGTQALSRKTQPLRPQPVVGQLAPMADKEPSGRRRRDAARLRA